MDSRTSGPTEASHPGSNCTRYPRPRVAIPQCGKQVQAGILQAAIVDRDANQDVFRRSLGILDKNVEVTIIVEDPSVDEFVLQLVSGASLVGDDDVLVGIGPLRVLIQVLHVRVRGRAVQVEVIFLDVLAVVAFRIDESEEALFQDGIFPVPQCQGEAQQLLVITDTCKTVFPPAIGPRAGLIMGEVIPGIAVGAVVLTDGSPLTFAEIGSPFFPRGLLLPVLFETNVLSGGT